MTKVTDLDNLKEFHRLWSYGWTVVPFLTRTKRPLRRPLFPPPGQPSRGGRFKPPDGPSLGRRSGNKCSFFIFIFSWVPGTTRPRRLLALWPLPGYQRVIGFSFQLAIIQHQFALHALGYCHLCKDALLKFRPDLKRRRLEMQLLE